MEEDAAYKSYLRLQDEEDLAALQQGVDELYEKVQDNVYMNLSRWEEYCDSLECSLPNSNSHDGLAIGDSDAGVGEGEGEFEGDAADADGDGTSGSGGTSVVTSSSDDDGPAHAESDAMPFTAEEEVALDYWRKRLAAAERKSSEIDGEIQSLERTLKILEAGTVGRAAHSASATKLSKVFEDVVKAAILLENQLKQRQDVVTPPDAGSASTPWGPQDQEEVADGLDQEEEIAISPESLTSMLSLTEVE